MTCLCKCDAGDVAGVGNDELENTSSSLRSIGKDCHQLAKETAELCLQTVGKGEEIVVFGNDLRDTLVGIASNMDASSLETIADLVDGDSVRAARGLAGEMDDLALTCVQKSVLLIKRMEEGVDALPDPIQNFVEKQASTFGGTEEEREMADVDGDIAEVQTCIQAIKDLNLCTAMEAGQNAFSSIASKADVCKTMFESIKKFADGVVSITEAFLDMDVKAVVSKVKDILRCLSLSNLMKTFAEQVGKLIKAIINLFKESSGKLSQLWSALAYAKECLSDCTPHANRARTLCMLAKNDSETLLKKCRAIKEDLEGVASTKAISSFKSLINGGDIKLAIDIADKMDDKVLECLEKVVEMVKRVVEGYQNLPEIITDGIVMEDAGNDEHDPNPVDIEKDIEDLTQATRDLESGNLVHAVQSSAESFQGLTEKVESAQDMLKTSEGFAENATKTIDSFMGVWNLEKAQTKIKEMCRLAKLGEMMKQFAEETKRLIKAIISLMKGYVSKFENARLSDLISTDIQGKVTKSLGDSFVAVQDVSKKLNCARG